MKPGDGKELEILFASAVLFFSCLVGFIIYFIVLYKNRQIKHHREQEHLQSNFRQELLKAQLEIQEQTLSHIGREIHDNIGQVLSFVKLNLGTSTNNLLHLQQKMVESRDLVAQAINDLRDLSKSMSFQHIVHLGLVKAIQIEAERVNKSNLLQLEVKVEGEIYELGQQCELVLFRIFQESLNNALKHAEAQLFKIDLRFTAESFNLTLEDDGRGFTVTERLNDGYGSGLKNIESRAAMIGAVASISSSPGNGCLVSIELNHLTPQINVNGSYTDRIG
jgi:signal transduction histidine kinase